VSQQQQQQLLVGRWKTISTKPSSTTPLGIPYTALTIGIPKEIYDLEKRVAATPESVERLLKKEFKAVHIETKAGEASCFTDAAYQAVGATIVEDAWKNADIILKVRQQTTISTCRNGSMDGWSALAFFGG
jgi:H+-translocating NAD(P) transhydrogenase